MILGRAYGKTAPVQVFSETFYADADLRPGSLLPLPDDHEDRGLYVVEGSNSVAGQAFESGRMMVFRPGDRISVAAGPAGAHSSSSRRDARTAPLHLVELRRIEPGSDRSRQGAVAQSRLRTRHVRPSARRPRRIHTAAALAAVSRPMKLLAVDRRMNNAIRIKKRVA